MNESSTEYRTRTVGNIFVKGETITHEYSGWDNYGVGGSIFFSWKIEFCVPQNMDIGLAHQQTIAVKKEIASSTISHI